MSASAMQPMSAANIALAIKERRNFMSKQVQMYASVVVSFENPVDIDKVDIDIGGFAVENEKGIIPFDFDASRFHIIQLSAKEYHIDYASGRAPAFYDFDVSDSCDEEYAKIGLSHQDITAQFLASATRIAEFYVGCNDVNGVPIPCEISVKKIVFYNEDGQRFAIKKDVLQKSNKK